MRWTSIVRSASSMNPQGFVNPTTSSSTPITTKYVRGLIFSKFHRWSPQSPLKLWVGHVDSSMGAVRIMSPIRSKSSGSGSSSTPSSSNSNSSNSSTTPASSSTSSSKLSSSINNDPAFDPSKNPFLKPKVIKKKKIDSILPAGTVMTGFNVLKDGKDPIAKENDKYPDWLWTLLDKEVYETDFDKFNPTYFHRIRKQKIRNTLH